MTAGGGRRTKEMGARMTDRQTATPPRLLRAEGSVEEKEEGGGGGDSANVAPLPPSSPSIPPFLPGCQSPPPPL